MQRHTLLNHHKTSLSPRKISVNPSFSDKNHGGFWLVRSVTPPIILNISFNNNHISKLQSVVFDGNQGYQLDNEEDDELCPIECVREFKTDDDFLKILEKGKDNGSLVVVDFYRTSCGSCKYIEQGFSKLCKGSGSREAPIIFLKHNVVFPQHRLNMELKASYKRLWILSYDLHTCDGRVLLLTDTS
ncbi:hypothetical protein GIB67_010767 [Kingdonia uniflora]|uniref:Thioredoxin-like protein n=1 Tax=Kingdonia uniflora TaxID=39325 RepID=A0A7J7L8S5_9MAGN|nr:hypothetical protein GIB67_010767 [Kingdonia uniflora]